MDILDKMMARGYDTDLEFYRSVIGSDIVDYSPPEYNELSTVIELGGIPAVRAWKELDIHTRARIRAGRMIRGMIEIIDAYYREKKSVEDKIRAKK